jgi:hypothetical protein
MMTHSVLCVTHAGKKQAVVAGVVEGSAAEQRRKVAGLNRGLAKESVQDGACRGAPAALNQAVP